MSENKKIFSRLLLDVGGALTGFAIGALYLHVLSDGMSLPLENSDGLVLISTTFTALLLSSFVGKRCLAS